MDQHLALPELDCLPQAVEICAPALVLVKRCEHGLSRYITAVVLHLDASMGIMTLELLVEDEMGLFPQSRLQFHCF